MNALVRLTVLLALVAPARGSSPRDLLNTDRTLSPAEVAAVLSATRLAIAGRTLRLSYGAARTGGTEVLMGAAGRPRFIRGRGVIEGGTVYGMASGTVGPVPPPTHFREERITIIDYTRRPARRCDGSAEPGELVVEYVHHGLTNTWNTSAHAETIETGVATWTHMFRMLSGVTPVASGERKQIGGRWARAFVAPWTPPPDRATQPELTGDPFPNVVGTPPPSREMTETLWIDTKSLLPPRWETTQRGYRFELTYERLDLAPPRGVKAPDCIP